VTSPLDLDVFDPRVESPLPTEVDRALGPQRRVGLQADSLTLLYGVIERCEAEGTQLVLFHRDFPDEQVARLAEHHDVETLVRESRGAPLVTTCPGGPTDRGTGGWLGLFTSGTSGAPKLAVHDWKAIARPADRVPERLRGERWLLAYGATTYAGLQVYFAARAAGGTLVRPRGSRPAEACRAIAEAGVGVVSATPTYWRMLIHAWPADRPRPRLRQATLGGEAVSQDTLDQVRAAFDPERITTVYASTEAGSAIVVSDGREGFPSAYLDDPGRPVRLRVRDGQLEIATSAGMRGYLGEGSGGTPEWIRTPDRVEVRGDRAYFVGRADTVVNVGGAKVAVDEVEAVLIRCDGVLDGRVYPRASVVVGAFLVADVVPQPGVALSTASLKSEMMRHLPPHAVPQQFRIVDSLEIAASGKKRRS
jgi:acyl-coenzyme A synthetase/AMP-(fatty) acid ligase